MTPLAADESVMPAKQESQQRNVMDGINRQALNQFEVELLAIAVASVSLWIVFGYWLYPLMGFPSTAPMPGRTVVVVLLIWGFMRRRGESWVDFGLSRSPRIWVTILFAIGFLIVKLLIVQPFADVIARLVELPKADHSFFDHIYGNFPALLAWLSMAWVVGGFAEEFIFRGFLMKRVAGVLRGGVVGWGLALFAQAAIFGALHFYLGPAGVVSATLSAIFFGLFFLIAGRSLWPVMIVHATWDSLAFLLIYLNGVPST